ncbi:CHAD domain-containing protein [Mesorhizobium sp. YR577]|uniref:CHAD domain-containing protein n=1 Tax=Mesorhizobium sp. YR577 TaxID=1884373 RepID=UPI0008E8C028|nr:CHAD domain-containing protein [Mesorhizobium sp. YR577]SFU17850.1 CHAD domain-containing protein [Mesorhizobium sp. YR577]
MNFRIDPRLPLTAEIRRIATEEIGTAMADLAAARTEPEVKLHQSRRRFKRLRALFRLVRDADEDFCRSENARYRDLGRSLAGAREATALIETIDRLIRAFPQDTAYNALAGPRGVLVARRAANSTNGAGLEADIDEALADCERGRMALGTFVLPYEPEAAADLLADGARKAMRQASRALEKAQKHGAPEDFHELRKCVKTHWMHLQLLHAFWPRPLKPRRKAVDELGERLGELNDLFVLRRLIDEEGKALGNGRELALLRRLIKRSEKALKKEALREAERLFDDAPNKTARRIVKNYQAGADEERPATDQ